MFFRHWHLPHTHYTWMYAAPWQYDYLMKALDGAKFIAGTFNATLFNPLYLWGMSYRTRFHHSGILFKKVNTQVQYTNHTPILPTCIPQGSIYLFIKNSFDLSLRLNHSTLISALYSLHTNVCSTLTIIWLPVKVLARQNSIAGIKLILQYQLVNLW